MSFIIVMCMVYFVCFFCTGQEFFVFLDQWAYLQQGSVIGPSTVVMRYGAFAAIIIFLISGAISPV